MGATHPAIYVKIDVLIADKWHFVIFIPIAIIIFINIRRIYLDIVGGDDEDEDKNDNKKE